MQDISSPPPLQAEIIINENFNTLAVVAVYGKLNSASTGLTWAYYGGRWGGFLIADGTLTLANGATNYIVVNRATGAASVSSANTNWLNVEDYARVYIVTTAGGVVTATEDHRIGISGIIGVTTGAAADERHAVPIVAASMRPSAVGGCAALVTIASGANQPDICSLNFDATTQEYAQFSIQMPKSWNEGSLTFVPVWSHPATTVNFGVVWDLQAVAIGDNEAMAAAYGTAQTSVDTGGTTDRQYIGPESSAITVGGAPVAEDVVHFRISRVTGNGSDTMAVDARLQGIVLFVVMDAEDDS